MSVVKPSPPGIPHLPQDPPAPPPPSRGVQRHVLLRSVRPAREERIRFELVGSDQPTGGVGVWGDVDRPRRRQATEFVSVSARRTVLPLLLDGMEKSAPGRDVSVEADCRRLETWASQPTKKTAQPCVVKVTGPLRTPDSVRWVIDGIEWGPQVRNARGKRVQQYVTLTLREYVEATVRRSPAKAARDRKGGRKNDDGRKGKD